MKRILLILSFLVLGATALQAQEETGSAFQEPVAPVDSTLLGRSALSVIGSGIEITQSDAVRQSLEKHIRSNAAKSISGYRIRVFSDNGPQARGRSASITEALREQLDVAVYYTFESPNYRVTVGDFRNKEEALKIYQALKDSYPTAYIIKETINYPK
ncbi:MAG: SPOR domain-containing protein [Bacteroidales bacterium]|nr:SPOR domain-containing protein [Bacteroidales bacterium]